VAREVGIMQDGDLVLTGADLDEMSDDDLDEVIERAAVFARVSPEHKYRVVGSLRRQGHVVSMTGDGINDAPALRLAEIGVSMGITGTDVTKESADMVLTDDNFASIVHAVEEGRTVFANVRKVVKFLIATNVGEMLTILTSLLIVPNGVMILTPVQILWVNLVTDGILDITLAMEPGEAGVMDDPPRNRNAKIINGEILRGVVLVALFMAAGTLIPFLANLNGRGIAYAQTMAFTTLAMFQVFNSLNCRSRTRSIFQMPLLSNPWLLGAIVVSVLLQIAANRLPFLQQVFGTEALRLTDWLMIVGIASTVLVADEIRKVFSRNKAAARAEAAQA
jgi:Ca2+-transporting ATPase